MAYSKLFRTHQRILIVDDEDAIVEGLAYLLTLEGYDVATAKNGVSALAALENKRPDLVVCDYMMPQMTGAQLAMEMRANRKHANIPVILCTGAHINQAESHADLFDVILTKPVKISSLLNHIKHFLTTFKAAVEKPEVAQQAGRETS